MNVHTLAPTLISLIDLTRLNLDDTVDDITALCAQAITPAGPVAAVCVYPQFVPTAQAALHDTPVKIATVVNFPAGNDALDVVVNATEQAVNNNVDEIDVVMPYHDFLAEEMECVLRFLQAVRAASKAVTLKVILETGALPSPQHIADAARLAITAGADFIKTSTGKIEVGATPLAAQAMLNVIQQHPEVGIKLSGGIRDFAQAKQYYDLIAATMDPDWITPQHVRFGASRLLQDLLP